MNQNIYYSKIKTLLFVFLLTIIFSFSISHTVKAAVVPAPALKITVAPTGAFKTLNGKIIYEFKNGSRARNGLYEINGKIYYFSSFGYRQMDWRKIGSYYYYFGNSKQGYLFKKCWLKKGGHTYLLRANGERAAGFATVNGKTYYFDRSTGIRQHGLQTINNHLYYFGAEDSGVMYKSKFARVDKKLYYFDETGKALKGWHTIDGYRYYFSTKYNAYQGAHTINGIIYNFASNGRLISTSQDSKLKIDSDCGILVDASNGTMLFGKNPDTLHANASTTKIMTCILALEKSSRYSIVTTSAYAASMEPTKMYFSPGESFRMIDLMYSLMLPSHNDTAVAIAEHIGGNVPTFVNMMNQKAKALGCKNTNFATPSGLDAGFNHYTTARDLSLIARHAIKSYFFRQIVQTPSYSYRNTDGKKYSIVSTNRLLLYGTPGVYGMKTGFTNKAGHCFVGLIKAKTGKEYICVILGGPDSNTRWKDAETLCTYAYNYK